MRRTKTLLAVAVLLAGTRAGHAGAPAGEVIRIDRPGVLQPDCHQQTDKLHG